MKIRISSCQFNIAYGDPHHNLIQAQSCIQKAAEEQSGLILFPELWTSGFDLENVVFIAEQNQRMLSTLKDLAKQYNIHIAGALVIREDERFFNRFLVISPNDGIVAQYDKIHLFGLMHEKQWLESGDKIVTFDLNGIKTGLAICYDLRFPELFRKLNLLGCQLVLISAEWPIQRLQHWQTLLRARAIENQYFIAAANNTGFCGESEFAGHSAIISPWGDIIKQADTTSVGLITAEVDMTLFDRARKSLVTINDRKPDIYQL
jgi:predicted amidohydrolase